MVAFNRSKIFLCGIAARALSGRFGVFRHIAQQLNSI